MPSKYAQDPTTTELALIEASTVIGSIVESNAQFTLGFASEYAFVFIFINIWLTYCDCICV